MPSPEAIQAAERLLAVRQIDEPSVLAYVRQHPGVAGGEVAGLFLENPSKADASDRKASLRQILRNQVKRGRLTLDPETKGLTFVK
jgi:hypothetical protein